MLRGLDRLIPIFLANLLQVTGYFLALPVLPIYLRSLGAREFEVGLVVSIMFWATLLSRPVAGRIADRGGRKGPLLFGVTLSAIALALYPLANNLWMMAGLRIVQGVAMAVFVTVSVAAVADSVPVARRGEALGLFGMSSNAPAAIGPAVGLLLMGHFGYETTFWAGALCGLVSLLFMLAVARKMERPQPRKSPDEGSTESIPFRPWRLAAPFFVIMGYSFSYAVLINFVPLLAANRGIGGVGMYFTVYAFSIMAARLFTGRIGDRYGRGWIIVPGALLAALGTAMLAEVSSLSMLMVSAVIYGIGAGNVHPGVQAQMIDLVPPGRRGTATAVFFAAFDLGLAVGGPVVGLLAQWVGLEGAILTAAGVCASGAAVHFLGPLLARMADRRLAAALHTTSNR